MPFRIPFRHVIKLKTMVLTSWRVQKNSPSTIIGQNGSEVIISLWILEGIFGEDTPNRVRADNRIVIVAPDDLPDRIVDHLYLHLLLVSIPDDFCWPRSA